MFDFNEKISQFVTIQSGNLSNSLRSIDYASLPQPSFNKNFEFLVEKLKQWKENDYRIIICAEQESQLVTYFGYDIFNRDPSLFQSSSAGAVDVAQEMGKEFNCVARSVQESPRVARSRVE